MVTTIPITKARVNLGSIVKRVALKRERFILEKDGYPVALITNIDDFEDMLEAHDSKIEQELARSQKDMKAGRVSSAREVLRKLKKNRK